MSTKEEVIKLIKDLPENATLEDIMRELYVRSKIDKGIKELNAGKVVSHDEVKEKLGKWDCFYTKYYNNSNANSWYE